MGGEEFRVEVGRGKESKGKAMNVRWRSEGEKRVRGRR